MDKPHKKTWATLENNPLVMNQLAHTLGLSPSLEFYDIYSLDQDQLSHIRRPCLALLVIIPLTPSWDQSRKTEDADKKPYTLSGHSEPVIWFKQTIGNACGSIGLLHSVINGPAAAYMLPGSDYAEIRERAIPLPTAERAEMLYHHAAFERAHEAVEDLGDSRADPSGGHFVSFVKSGGRLWELEGSRRGPLDRGELGVKEDVLCERALEMGVKRIIGLNAHGEGEGDGGGGESLRFSVTALARRD